MRSLALILILLLTAAFPALAGAPFIPCRVQAEFPHDPETSTQGLFLQDGRFYESSGGYGRSFLTVVEPETGRRLQTVRIPPDLFAEGIAPYGGTLRLLTWQSGIGHVYTLEGLELVSRFNYRGTSEGVECWGLTFDGDRFILSSGTSQLRFHDPRTFKLLGRIEVTDDGRHVGLLNELEWVDGLLYANVWKSDLIAIIDTDTGTVRAWLDLSPLRERIGANSGVANGIAYDRETGRLFVTGKLWDKLFEIEKPKL